MHITEQQRRPLVGRQDVARWITFSSFWGFIFYLLSFAGLLAGHRRGAPRVNANTAFVGMGVHVAVFNVFGFFLGAMTTLTRGKSTTEQARERIGGGSLDRNILAPALVGAVGAVVPLTMASGSLKLAERITGEAAFSDGEAVDWPQAIGVTASLSGLTALAVSRIVAWVARDARTSATSR